MPKKIYIRTFGCQMNARDSEFVMGILLDSGFTKADSINRADVILFNSCSVRKHAEDRLFSNISDLKPLKEKKPHLVIGLIGCTAQNYKDEILRKLPMVDLVCGPSNESDLADIIKDVLKNRCSIIATNKVNEKKEELFPEYREQKFKAYVSISEGCDNFCSYCIVPYVRGRERSRELEDIIRETVALGERGCKEITLLGQNVNSYRDCPRRPKGVPSEVEGRGLSLYKNRFVKLLEKLNKIKGIERIRFMTSHPKDASRGLFKAMRDLDKVCEHLHLPLQSGSDRVLKLMKRGYTAGKYLALVDDYRRLLPEGSVTTDIIIGFPSETEKDFLATLDMMKKISFDSAFIFKYSPRPPAKSSGLKDDVPKEVKEERLKTLLDLQCEISRLRNKSMEGKVIEVLVDGQNDKGPHLLSGRTRTNKIAVFKGDKLLIGKLVNVKVEETTPHTLKGEIVK